MPWKTHGDARGKTMNEESIIKQEKTLKFKRFLARHGSHIVGCAVILAIVSMALLLYGTIIGVYVYAVALPVLFIGAYGDLYLRKHIVTQEVKR